jgi:hypothetical protein
MKILGFYHVCLTLIHYAFCSQLIKGIYCMNKKLISLLIVIFSIYYSPMIFAEKGKDKGKDKGTSCYVSGNPEYNEHKHQNNHQLGSDKIPYSTLAEVVADGICQHIHVLYSDTALDGGIILRDGQKLTGEKGKDGKLPIITNSTFATTFGMGVILAKNNEVKNLHFKDTQNSSIFGSFQIQPFEGKLKLDNVIITGANQAGLFNPGLGGVTANPSVLLVSIENIDISIKKSDIGQSNVGSIIIYSQGGHTDVAIKETNIHDQAQLSENHEQSPGITIIAVENSSITASLKKVKVDNIGSEFNSNSDGLVLLNQGTGHMSIEVDEYHFTNPDGGGKIGTSTGIEMGFFDSIGGGSFNGVVTNSVIEDAWFTGIQVLDQLSGGNNTLTAEIRNNKIKNCAEGISGGVVASPNSSMFLDITDNVIDSPKDRGEGRQLGGGISIGAYHGDVDIVEAYLENNVIVNAETIGLAFALFNATANSILLDAGLGELGSAGQNSIVDSGVFDISSDGVAVSAAGNWWGSEAGPASINEVNGGTIDITPFLLANPK